MPRIYSLLAITACVLCFSCDKGSTDSNPPPPQTAFQLSGSTISGQPASGGNYNIGFTPLIRLNFNGKVDKNTVTQAVSLRTANGPVPFTASYANGDSSLLLQPSSPLPALTRYSFALTTSLKATTGVALTQGTDFQFVTKIDSTDKFPLLSDEELLTLVQRQTFKYFWDFAHPVSGLARERNNSGDVVTSGGSGFGIMAIVTGVSRGFITRAQGLERMQKIVAFLGMAQKFKGAFPHWLNGSTGAVVPFSAKDNGADLVETSFLMQGLLTARQFFNSADAAETTLRDNINTLWRGVEWSWFRKGSENVLYWHWSPDHNWEMNLPIRGWNESLITYLLAAASPTFAIPKAVYDNGWASNGGIRNGNTYYGVQLPLGPPNGGPLFFAHYSFLGINPKGLKDAYADDYWRQNVAHTQINYNYSKANPKGWYGYSDSTWGLTASDNQSGYSAHSPNNDLGVITPTAALSSFPYTPTESMKALKFFYYRLGDKLWGEYGFKDAFNLSVPWFASSYLAIDQGPIIVMIENHRTGLLWDLFMSAPEVKTGLRNLGFQGPGL